MVPALLTAAVSMTDFRLPLFGPTAFNFIDRPTPGTEQVNFTENFNHACRCIGYDGPSQGQLSPGSPFTFPDSYGDSCEAHDSNLPSCQGVNNSACTDKWCFVDPNTCDRPIYPSLSFPGRNLYFSYMACDTAFSGNDNVGHCECVGNGNYFEGDQGMMFGTSSYGGAVTGTLRGCQTWDKTGPLCAEGGPYFGEPFCDAAWCFVDVYRCANETFAFPIPNGGATLHFSYGACGNVPPPYPSQ